MHVTVIHAHSHIQPPCRERPSTTSPALLQSPDAPKRTRRSLLRPEVAMSASGRVGASYRGKPGSPRVEAEEQADVQSRGYHVRARFSPRKSWQLRSGLYVACVPGSMRRGAGSSIWHMGARVLGGAW